MNVGYSFLQSSLHWVSAPVLIGSIGCVLKAQNSPKGEKGKWMHRHKSLGLLSFFVLVPRVGAKLMSSRVMPLLESSPLEQAAAKASHFALYGFMTVMPVSGIAMGLYGGKGLPFFYTTLGKGWVDKDGKFAGKAFKIHKTIGTYGKYLVPLHVGAAGAHAARGHGIFHRVSPWRSTQM
eukprot:CAMPEP_0182462228 /NCGR_PEP_ID=MMETSP1319-20130603/6567_1 /TAXON_ID=172717 /ORGANISM="Bolidomonas pacifica, Strain RCC208" /LENGTH=178 /DNA_ID=CAMNT_0024661633 /DNA_START=140 /DNA_END=676 /DNA_ORIENTATION=-